MANPEDLYSGRAHSEALEGFAARAHQLAVQVRAWDATKTGEDALYQAMGPLLESFQAALDATPQAKLRALRRNALRRITTGATIAMAVVGILVSVVAFGKALMAGDQVGQVLAFALVLAGFAVTERMSKVPGPDPVEVDQYQILVAWQAGKPCPICEHRSHLPGQCCAFAYGKGLRCHCGHG